MATPHYDSDWLAASTLPRPAPDEIRFNAKYQCKHCNESWKVKSTSKLQMSCQNKGCLINVRAYKFEPIDTLVVYSCPNCGRNKIKQTRCESEIYNDVPLCKICMVDMKVDSKKHLWKKVRKFGEFYCHNCNRNWSSGNSWEGYGQQCKICNYMILPHRLSPLRPSNTFINHGEQRPPHQEHLCEMCQKIGQNCQTYVPPDQTAELDEIPLEEDLQSVITTNSSIPGDHHGNDEDTTPINSENGERPNDLETIEELDQMIKDLQLNDDSVD